MRRIILCLMALVMTTTGFSQNYKSNKKEAEKIKKSGTSFFAESGECNTLEEAENMAKMKLIANIHNNCNATMAFFDDDDESRESQSIKVFNTFRDDILAESVQIVLSNDQGKANVFRYLKKDSFNSICDNREDLINLYVAQGMKADNDEKENASIGDALRCYYWALILCYSHPYGSTITLEDPVTNDDVVMKEWLYDKIDELLKRIRFIPKPKPVLKTRESVAYELAVTDGSDLIPWLKFEYNDGNGTMESSVESGMASVELVDKDIDEFQITVYIENKLEAQARAKEVYSIMRQLDSQIYFQSALKKVNVKKAKDEYAKAKVTYQDSTIIAKKAETEKFIEDNAPDKMAEFMKAMKNIEKAIRNKDISEARKHFTDNGYEMFNSLLNNGKYYILGTPEYKFIEFKDQMICRCIPMQFNFNNNVGFVRNVVFRFEKDSCKVSSIAFRLTDVAEIDILGKDQWRSESKMVLINFLEDYQTAYALKRIDYLDKIFSDDALIIVGTVLKQKQKGDNMQLSTQARVRYDTLSKERYIGNLRKVFVSNEFVNIRFMDTDFTQHQSGLELYGIQLKQEYLSSSYGDVGYLFLMVDLREELPIIHVRTWEPEKTEHPIGFDDIDVKII